MNTELTDFTIIFQCTLSLQVASTTSGNENCWYYEGRNGWWKFDERSNEDLETLYAENPDDKIELLICGHLYVIDFEANVQFRKDGTGRVRRIKRDKRDLPAKGVAGLIVAKCECSKNM